MSIGPYRIIEALGSGANGEVYLAEDVRLGRKVAVKTLSALDSKQLVDAQRWVLREARAAARLNHPHIASVYDVIESPQGAHIVMEYVRGETLAARLRTGPLPAGEVIAIAIQLTDALAEAHGMGVVHRDLKPANVILTPKGDVKILDFGLAQVRPVEPGSTPVRSSRDFTLDGRQVGTPPYMPPEHLMGDRVDARGDLYSLGVMLYELLTGRRPFRGPDAMALTMAILTEPTPRASGSNDTVPPALDAIVFRAMSRLPQDRYASAAEMADDLRRASMGQELAVAPPRQAVSEAPTASWPRVWPVRLVRPQSALSLAAVGVVIVLGVYDAVSRGRLPVTAQVIEPPVIAVLPLTGVTGDSQDESLATGIADSLISSLSRITGLTVVSRQATLPFRDRKKDTATIARALGATVVVDGAMQRSGDKVRVSLSILHPETRTVAWSNTYDGSFADVFQLQSAVGAAVANALRVTLSPEDRRQLGSTPTGNIEAFADYAQARAFLERPDVKDNLERSLELSRAAVAKDPRFARAHAGLGEAYWRRFKAKGDVADAIAARDAAAEALRLDAGDASVHYTLAKIYRDTGRVDASSEELRSALRIQPKNDEAHSLLGQILAQKGELEASVAEINEAIALRPNYWAHHYALGLTFYGAGRFSDAVAAFGRVTELQPDNSWGFQMLGTSYHALDDTPKAIANYRRAIQLGDAMAYSNLGLVYLADGRFAEAARAYEEAIRREPRSPLKHRILGDCYSRLGQEKRAQTQYRQALQLGQEELRTNPRDGSSLSMVAIAEAKLGMLKRAEQDARTAVSLNPAGGEVLYRQAVVYALTGKLAESMDALEQALARGYSVNHARKDHDLESLRTRSEFTKLVSRTESVTKQGGQ
jgi:TolB-like protein/Tfp pilus assembly protein PilF